MPIGNLLAFFCIGISALGGFVILTSWIAMEWSRRKEGNRTGRSLSRFEFAERYMLRWTWFDYYMLMLFMFGFVFLLGDVVGVARQPEIYPSWHYGYVLIGAVVLFHAFGYFIFRYVFLLRTIEKLESKTTGGEA
jgi:hypothetical protein